MALALTVVSIPSLSLGFMQAAGTYARLPELERSALIAGVPIGAYTMTLSVVAIVVAAAIATRPSPAAARSPRILLASALVIFGGVGWWAAFALAADKVLLAIEPGSDLSCNVSLLVQCGANLESWQGSVFGFPNPLIGLAGWAAVAVVGCLVLARVSLAPWFWIAFNLGVAAALAFVVWLIAQSIFVLGTLCPWCMVTWAVTIPLFWAVTLHNASWGRFGEWMARAVGPAYGWVPAITIGSYIVVAVVAQLRLDVLGQLG